MKKIFFTLSIIGALALSACSWFGTPQTDETKDTATKTTTTTADQPSDLKDPDTFCNSVVASTKDVGARHYDTMSTDHQLSYGGRRTRCTYQGYDSKGLHKRDAKILEFEVECTKKTHDEAFCAKTLKDAGVDEDIAKSIGGIFETAKGDIYADPIDGAACHTLSSGVSGNFVYYPNGCYAIMYEMTPPADAKDADARKEARKNIMFEVAKAVAKKFSM